MLDGVRLTQLRIIPLDEGDVLHGMKAGDPGFSGFGEAYFSTVVAGHVKAWKKHRQMTLNFVVPTGRIKFVIHDERLPNVFEVVELSRDNYQRLTVAPGLWVGFASTGEGPHILLNVANIPHDPAECERRPVDAFGYPW